MARPKQMLIDRKSIVAAAIKLLEREGLDGFNLRTLADTMSVHPASLYHYFDGKEAILSAAAGQILREVEVPPDRYEWKRWMVESSINFWRVLIRKPFLSPIMLAGYYPATEVGAQNRQMMSKAGISPAHQEDITRAFSACAIGSALIATSREIVVNGKHLDPEETLRLTLTLLLESLAKKHGQSAKTSTSARASAARKAVKDS